MREVDVRTVDRGELVQRSHVELDRSKEPGERIKDYISRIGNPYCYLEGDTVVKHSFAETSLTLEDCLRGYLGGL